MTDRRRTAATEAYVTEVHRHLTTMLGRRFAPDLTDEMVQEECLRLLERIDEVMAGYPDPVVYAKVCATGRHALLRLMRTDDVQAGRGARRGRVVEHGDAHPRSIDDRPGRATDIGSLYERYARRTAQHTDTDELLDRRLQLQELFAALTPRERTLLYLVDAQGHTVTEAARRLHIARETAARLRSAVYRRLAEIG